MSEPVACGVPVYVENDGSTRPCELRVDHVGACRAGFDVWSRSRPEDRMPARGPSVSEHVYTGTISGAQASAMMREKQEIIDQQRRRIAELEEQVTRLDTIRQELLVTEAEGWSLVGKRNARIVALEAALGTVDNEISDELVRLELMGQKDWVGYRHWLAVRDEIRALGE